ncbi:MAG: diguanylate cyclase [Alphaproteobacteria bacterium]|nr:diguanylate cyclase [Alphaproteobacteria bacterium]MBM3642058.1 diguanylate cyclase [Alphaproteobacteria bacterium]
MRDGTVVYSLPRWPAMRWLTCPAANAPDDIRVALIGGLFGTLPIFAGGVISTILVTAAIAVRHPTPPFVAWLIIEVAICSARLSVLFKARSAASQRRATPTDLYLLLSLFWSASIGYGGFVSLTSGDWVIATLACSTAMAMVGGVCLRAFNAPRLATAMMLVSLGPFVPAVLIAGKPLLYVVLLQVPLFLAAMSSATFTLNKMLLSTMQSERENEHRARHDTLTGLANRLGLAEAVDAGLKAERQAAKELAVLFLDLDNFKAINDTHGHVAGDRLLKMVAERLRRSLRATDVAARIGGDEFVVLAKGLTGEQATELGNRLTNSISAPYDLGGGICATIGVSVGVALAPKEIEDAEGLLSVADAALYAAKAERQVKLLRTLVGEDPSQPMAPAAGA